MRPLGGGAPWRWTGGWAALLLAGGVACAARPAAAQDLPPLPPAAPEPLRLTVTVPADAAASPVVRATGLLRDAVFAGALRDGFPIRFQYRLEAWRDSWLFDHLEREQTWLALAVLDPLTGAYTLTRDDGSEEEFTGIEGLARALSVPYTVDLPLPRGGRFYYVASLDIESLSLSELEEVERWLRGDLGRAIAHEGDVGSALERGARRLLIRFSGLPRRRLETRSPVFRR